MFNEEQGKVGALITSIGSGCYKVSLQCLNVHQRRKHVAKVDVGIHPELIMTNVDLVAVAWSWQHGKR